MKKNKAKSIEEKRAIVVIGELKKLYPEEQATPLNYITDIDLIVAVMLSAQSTDKGVNKLTASFFQRFKTALDYAETTTKSLESELSSINYYRTKARNIQKTMRTISNLHEGRVPRTMDSLLELPGVGRKTANVILGHLFKKVEGIAVDTHVMRLSRKFGLSTSLSAKRIEQELMLLIPQKEWWGFSNRIKAYGREVSPARGGSNDPITKKLLKLKLIDSK